MSEAHHHHEPGDRPANQQAAFDAHWWEQHYRDAGQAGGAGLGTPTPYVLALGSGAGRTALDVGCGTGADAVALAQLGWHVTAVDIAPTAIERAQLAAAQQAPDQADQITWLVTDVMTAPPADIFDAVISQYVHPDAPYEQFLTRLAGLVAEGGTLLVVGHDHADAHSTEHAPRDAALGLGAATTGLDPAIWRIEIAETRERHLVRDGGLLLTDTVVQARRI